MENDRIVSDDNEVANIINDYYSCLLENLKLQVPKNVVNCSCQSDDPIFKAILKYQYHPIITAIKEMNHMNHFSLIPFR